MKVGIVGCGFIGTEVAKFVDSIKNFKLAALNDVDSNKVRSLVKHLKNNNPEILELDELMKKSDLIIESANKNAIIEILKSKNLDQKNKKLLIMSTGGLIGNLNLLNKIKNCEIILPSGAIAGLDAIKAVSGKIKSLSLTTTKNVKGLEDAPYITKNRINLSKVKDKKIMFDGNLDDAIQGFPQNINVAATLFMASKFDKIQIKIIADSKTRYNTHEIKASGDFGEINIMTKNLPSENPRTSYLALLSAIQAIRNIEGNIKIGN